MGENEILDVGAGERHTIIVTRNKNNNETEIFGTGYNING